MYRTHQAPERGVLAIELLETQRKRPQSSREGKKAEIIDG